jgi:steroid 5-alpha reductase family enzyme
MQLVLYLVQRATRDAGIVDAGWAFGLGALAVFYAVCGSGSPARRVVLAVVAGTWSLRLAGYLFVNRVLGGEEDGRYQMLRESWGEKAQLYFFLFFQVQATWSVLFSVPYLVVAHNGAAMWRVWDVLGILVAVAAIGGESLADWQLARFRANPEHRGTTCRVGLWRYSRHPNYFFEWLHWWAYVLLAAGGPYWWVSLSGPVVMLLFLYKITGIPYTETRAIASRGEDYLEYRRTTSAFIPWFPKRAGREDTD